MKGKCEFMRDKVLVEYYYNGHEKKLSIYENKKLVRTIEGDDAVREWHEITE